MDYIAATQRIFLHTRQVVLLVLFQKPRRGLQSLTESMRHTPRRLHFNAVPPRPGLRLAILEAIVRLWESLLKSQKISTAHVGAGAVGGGCGGVWGKAPTCAVDIFGDFKSDSESL